MFKKVFIEESEINNIYAKHILSKIKFEEIIEIDRYEDIWGKVKKPYLQKRENLNLFIAKKKGQLVKEAPSAYGHGSEKHFYYIHAYNCIYECQYCYLQGYFSTPDLVYFTNHEEILDEIKNLSKIPENKGAWFHAGEYSDSLSLSHITNELPLYFDFFRKNPGINLELRTKSVNTTLLLNETPTDNIFISFTLSSEKSGKNFDLKCPSVKARLNAIDKLVKHGYKIGIHFDPIIYQDNFIEQYKEVIKMLSNILPDKHLGYISLGVVRYTKDVYREVEKNYPDSTIVSQDYIKSFDGKVRYNLAMRMWLLNSVKSLCLNSGYSDSKIYLCMEEN